MLRDPVDRYASGYARENRLARERGEEGISPAMVDDQRERGFYAGQVERVLEAFPRERVLILQYERCRAEYEGELERTYGFLGLDIAFRPEGWRNAPAEPRERDTPAAEQGSRRTTHPTWLAWRRSRRRSTRRCGPACARCSRRPLGLNGTKTPCTANGVLGDVEAMPSAPPSNTCSLSSAQIARSPSCAAPGTTASTVVETAQVEPTDVLAGRRARHRDVERRVLHGAVVRWTAVPPLSRSVIRSGSRSPSSPV